MTIGATGSQVTAARAALPTRTPDDDPQARRRKAFPSLPNQAAAAIDADAQAAADPLRPTAADGWSPDKIVAVRSRHDGGFLGSALNFTLGGVDEHPGQRLSVGQVNELAPFYATQFGLDEGYVRRELAKVYVYVGGPSVDGQAMTIGHHIFVPDEASLERIMTRPGKRWLSHELAHTMQYLAYQNASPQSFLADYFSSMIIGKDPQKPGSGEGPNVWGAFFTGLGTSGKSEDDLGKGSTTLREKLMSTIVPAAVVSIPVAVTAGGALKAARVQTGRHILGTGNSMGMAITGIATPALAGSAIGLFHDQLGDGWTKVLGAGAGGALAGLAMWKGGAFNVGGSTAVTEVGRALGRTSAIGLAVGATIGGAAIGLLTATASANTMEGWSHSADVLRSLQHRPAGEAPRELDLQNAVHDSHWLEIDAEATARTFISEWKQPAPGAPPVEGRNPGEAKGLKDRIETDVASRVDWGVKVPLIVGIPAAIGLGAGVLATRTGVKVLRTTFQEGRPITDAIGEAMRLLGSNKQGVGNSLGVGASLTLAPLMAGGIVGPVVYNATGSETAARLGGAGAGAVATGALLTMLLKGRGGTLLTTSGKVGLGMAVAGAIGFMASGVATDALRPGTREYDASNWARS
ncbi:MAG: hypothetical protein JWL76_964 [Thermoleophilia bacterium]|nr:hypothetical protein [Thermoleophilia bacterium]